MESSLKAVVTEKIEAILSAIDIIEQRCLPYRDVHTMLSDFVGVTVFDSCVMRLQTIGENLKSIDERTNGLLRAQYPEIPWRNIIGLRNIISHEYTNIDPDVIWSIISRHLVPLRAAIAAIRADLE